MHRDWISAIWLSLVAISLVCADEQIPVEKVKKAAELAEASTSNDDKKFVEIFSAAIQSPESLGGVKSDDSLTKKRNAEILKSNRPEDSIYSNARFYQVYAGLVRDSTNGARIWGGKKTKPGEFDACVAVGNKTEYFCSGTLIADRLVCTAGHCFDDEPSKIFVGASIPAGKEYGIRANGVIRHPQYHAGPTSHNDLTLLILDKAVTNVQPMKIANTFDEDTMRTVRIVGFGNTDTKGESGYGTKKVADVVVVSPDGVRFNKNYGADPGLEFVAEDRHADSCTGDSGGPAFLANESGDWQLAGATSRPTRMHHRDCGDGGIYVRMDKYSAWILQVAQQNGISLPQ